MRKMIAMQATTIIPGHGPVMHDYSYLEKLIPLFEGVSAQVKAAADAGLSLEETYKKIDLNAFRDQLAGKDGFRRHAFDEYFVQPAVNRAYQEAKGKMNPETLAE
jgi:hypothetical protein